jgi:hypothetical protein
MFKPTLHYSYSRRIKKYTSPDYKSLNPTATALRCSIFDDEEDPEEAESFKEITTAYLLNKYRDCKEEADGTEQCRFLCDQKQIEEILVSILPPMTKSALAVEVETVMSKFEGKTEVEPAPFVQAMMDNSYWQGAGTLVVKELIFLDCLYHYYRDNQVLLEDEMYNELKEQLTWEGSAVATMRGNEALFVTAVANSRRGTPIMEDSEYSTLKEELKQAGSWVATREFDPLEKLGLQTFVSYLHGAME